jgi:signal transduction histidine kinase
MAAGDDERRRVVRNLHDGAQQRLVQALLMMNLAARELRQDPQRATQLIDEAIDQIMRGIDELCALAHGVMPAVLTRCGLSAGIKALSDRLPMPVDIDLDVGRLAPTIEATAYFVAAEALTNVARHARADRAQVTARIERNCLHLEIRDNGIGGVKPGGRGLVGLRDRVAVVNGRLHVTEPAEGGTLVTIDIPLPG